MHFINIKDFKRYAKCGIMKSAYRSGIAKSEKTPFLHGLHSPAAALCSMHDSLTGAGRGYYGRRTRDGT